MVVFQQTKLSFRMGRCDRYGDPWCMIMERTSATKKSLQGRGGGAESPKLNF